MFWCDKLTYNGGGIEMPSVIDAVPIKKRIYHDFMYCEKCKLEYNKSDEYEAKRCVQCGRKLVKRRELAAIFDEKSRCYTFRYINLKDELIRKRKS